jgi:hypothetical protein
MFTKKFWKDAVERSIRAGAWTLVAIAGTAGFSLLSVSWPGLLAAIGLAMVVSLAGSLAVNAASSSDTASIVVNTVEKPSS